MGKFGLVLPHKEPDGHYMTLLPVLDEQACSVDFPFVLEQELGDLQHQLGGFGSAEVADHDFLPVLVLLGAIVG